MASQLSGFLAGVRVEEMDQAGGAAGRERLLVVRERQTGELDEAGYLFVELVVFDLLAGLKAAQHEPFLMLLGTAMSLTEDLAVGRNGQDASAADVFPFARHFALSGLIQFDLLETAVVVVAGDELGSVRRQFD